MSVYSCYATDPTDRRVKSETLIVQSGWRVMRRGETREPVMVEIRTDWTNTECMRLAQSGYTDHECKGCVHDKS